MMLSKKEEIQDKLTYILQKSDLERVSVKIGEDGAAYITLDIHGWPLAKTQKVMQNLILLQREAFNLNIVHGYLHGMATKEMLLNEFTNCRLIKKRSYNENPGITFMRFKAA